MRTARTLALALALAAGLAACGGGRENRVTALGSSSMDQVMGTLAEQYALDHPEAVVSVEGGGSAAGVEAVANGVADIGLCSRALKGAERERGLTETVLALDGIAVIVSADNPVNGLTLKELAALYTGEITSWAQLGGPDVPVACVGREAGSGTRDGFEEATGTQGRCVLAQELTSTGAVLEAVGGNVSGGAVGYASLSAVEGRAGVKPIPIDGVDCTEGAVLDGSYPVRRPFVLVTQREMAPAARAFFDWAVSPAAADTIRAAGAIPAAQHPQEGRG